MPHPPPQRVTAHPPSLLSQEGRWSWSPETGSAWVDAAALALLSGHNDTEARAWLVLHLGAIDHAAALAHGVVVPGDAGQPDLELVGGVVVHPQHGSLWTGTLRPLGAPTREALLRALAESVAAGRSAGEVQAQAAAGLERLFAGCGVLDWAVGRDGSLAVKQAVGLSPQSSLADVRLSAEQLACLREQRGRVCADVAPVPRPHALMVALSAAGFAAMLDAVYDDHDGILRVLTIASPTARTWSTTDLDTLGAVAGQLHVARQHHRERALRRASEHVITRAQRLDALGRLAGGMAHDLRNMVHAIRLSTTDADQLLREGRPTDVVEARESLQLSQVALERAEGLVSKLLSIGRTSLHEPLVGRHELSVVVDSARRLTDATVPPDRSVVSVFAEAAEVNGERAALELAVVNLILNALDAIGPGGGIQLRVDRAVPPAPVRHAHGLREEPHARVVVDDDGCGIPADSLPLVFEPFFTEGKGASGTGLGLAMVKHTARRCGGAATLESVEGQGTTATLWLPLASNSSRQA